MSRFFSYQHNRLSLKPWGAGLLLLGLVAVNIQPVVAATLQIFASVAANPTHFQIELPQPANTTVGPNSIIEFRLRYGSYLPTQTDTVVLQVGWSQGQIGGNPSNLIAIAEYVAGSAGPAVGNTQPTIDLVNRTITWQINPMPPGADRELTWQLRTNSAHIGSEPVTFTITARLIGPGLEKAATPLTMTYRYEAPPVTPTPTPQITPTPTAGVTPLITPTPPPPAVTPTPPNLLAPLIGRIKDIPVIGKPIKEVIDTAEDIAQNGGSIVTAPIPVAVAIIPTLANLIPLLTQVPWWQIPSLLAALLWKKRRRSWGVVYDSVTKQPLDPVLVTLTDAAGKSYQAISDIYGRYQFLVEAGRYKLTAQKTNYKFPSLLQQFAATDGVYQDLYYGSDIVLEEASAVNFNIPMDPVGTDWNQQKKVSMGLTNRFHLSDKFLDWMFWGGFTWSLLMVLLAASPLNLAVIGLYALLIGLRLYHRWRSPWGVVYGPNNKPLESAAVHLVDLEHPLVKRPPVVTKTSGHYAFLVDKGKYQLNVAVKKPYGYGAPVAGPTITISSEKGTISQDLEVENLTTSADANAAQSTQEAAPPAGIMINPNSRFNKQNIQNEPSN